MLTIPCQITATSIDDGILTLEFTPWLNATTNLRIPVATPDIPANADGQRLLSRICRALGIFMLKDEQQFVGCVLKLRISQPKVAAGIQSAPVVVEVVTC
jgi:hypothetical protein